jgi:hypothetical protein
MYFIVGLSRGGHVSANQFDALCAKLFRSGKVYIDPKIPHNNSSGGAEGTNRFDLYLDAPILENYLITRSANWP